MEWNRAAVWLKWAKEILLFDGFKSGDHQLRLVVHPRWCMISSINSMTRTVDRADFYF